MTDTGSNRWPKSWPVRIRLGESLTMCMRPVFSAGALEPVEQHGLSMPRPHHGHVVRRSLAAEKVRQTLPEHRLFPLAPGQRRRGNPVPGVNTRCTGSFMLGRPRHANVVRR